MKDVSATRSPRSGDWISQTSCSECGAKIPAGEDRIVAAVLEFADDGVAFRPHVGAAIYYCPDCGGKREEFRIRNPWPRPNQTWPVPNTAEPMGVPTTDGERNSAATVESRLARSVAAGNMQAFNASFPAAPLRTDALAHSESIGSREPCGIEAAGCVPISLSSINHVRKERLRSFINSPASRGMRREMREAARKWVNGMSQANVAKSMRLNQATISRMVNDALRMADG
jgi:hypothetical protein